MFYCQKFISNIPSSRLIFIQIVFLSTEWLNSISSLFLFTYLEDRRETDKRVMGKSHETSNIEEETMQTFLFAFLNMAKLKIAVGRQNSNKRVEEFLFNESTRQKYRRQGKTQIWCSRKRQIFFSLFCISFHIKESFSFYYSMLETETSKDGG